MNPMTTNEDELFKGEQAQYGCNNTRMPAGEQEDDDLMLGNMPLFNHRYCDQMTDKLRHLNMARAGQRKGSFRTSNRLERHPFNVIHPLKVINCSKDSAGSLGLSKQGSGASTGSNTMVNPLGLSLDGSRKSSGSDPLDQILNIDDLLIKNEDDKCDSARGLQSVVGTEAQDEASRSAGFTLSPLKREFPTIAQNSAQPTKFTLDIGSLTDLQPQHSLVTEATSNSGCSTELEYKATPLNCQSFLRSKTLSVLPEQDEEHLEPQL
jgi:hypothetical protein